MNTGISVWIRAELLFWNGRGSEVGGSCEAGWGEEDSGRAAAAAVETLERSVWRNDLHRRGSSVRWILRCGFCANIGVAVQDSKSGAAAAGRVDVDCGAGGARYSGPTGPDPGGGERLTDTLNLNDWPAAVKWKQQLFRVCNQLGAAMPLWAADERREGASCSVWVPSSPAVITCFIWFGMRGSCSHLH